MEIIQNATQQRKRDFDDKDEKDLGSNRSSSPGKRSKKKSGDVYAGVHGELDGFGGQQKKQI